MKKFKNHKTLGAFDADIRIEKLIKLDDPLHRLSQGVDFELFRNLLTEKLTKLAKGAGGRPAYDYVMGISKNYQFPKIVVNKYIKVYYCK